MFLLAWQAFNAWTCAWQTFQLRFDSMRQSCRDRYTVAHSLSCFTLSSSSSASVACRGCWDAGSGTLLPLLEEDSIASLVLFGGGTSISLFWPFSCLQMGWTRLVAGRAGERTARSWGRAGVATDGGAGLGGAQARLEKPRRRRAEQELLGGAEAEI